MNFTFIRMNDSEAKPRIALGADHAGYHLKESLKKFLQGAGYSVDDAGTWSEESVDYPDFARKVGDRVAAGEESTRHPRVRHGNRHVHRREQSREAFAPRSRTMR